MVWGKMSMRQAWGPAGRHDPQRQNALITTGPFRLTRNPIYLGLLGLATGFFLTLESPLVIVVLPLAAILSRAAAREERFLERQFGDKYRRYMQVVPRYL